DDDVERAVLYERRIPIGRLPLLQQVVPKPGRIGQRVERKGVLGRSLDAEEVDLGTEREDEVVVVDRRHIGEANLSRAEVDRRHLVLVRRCVLLLLEQVPNRMADRRLLEQSGRDLVQQWLKGVVVVLIDEHDVDVALPQLLSGAHTAEAAAQDEHARPPTVGFGSRTHGLSRRYGQAPGMWSPHRGEPGSLVANSGWAPRTTRRPSASAILFVQCLARVGVPERLLEL